MACSSVRFPRTAHNLAEKQRTEDVELRSEATIDFPGLLLSPSVLLGLKNAGFVRPSPIQLEAIPVGRCGADLIVQAKSGTGKTCVFAVVALESVATDNRHVQVLVLAPTREIAVQVHEVIVSLATAMPGFKCDFFIGGTPFAEDRVKMKRCQMAIGTPGRIQQLIKEKVLRTDAIRLFVLDEADKLLDEKFQDTINWIYHRLPSVKQMLALSATYPESLAQLLAKYMQTPVFVRMSEKNPALIGVKQFYATTEFHPLPAKAFENKVSHVLCVLSTLPFGQCIVFSNYQMRAQALCDRLVARGWPATYISSQKEQTERLRAISSLRKFKCRVLVSTDLTARGIDVENVNLVINLDVPWDLETYLHRIGRAGRFGSHGIAITFASTGDEEKLLMGIKEAGKLGLDPLPGKLGPDVWETLFLAGRNPDDVPTADEVPRKTNPGSNGHRGPEPQKNHDRSAREAAPPLSAGTIEMLKRDRNLELEAEGIRRKQKRGSSSSRTGKTSVHPSKSQSETAQNAGFTDTSASVKILVCYGTVDEDDRSLREFVDANLDDCGICRGGEVVSPAEEPRRSSAAEEDQVREILERWSETLVEGIRSEEKDGFLETVSGILDLPPRNLKPHAAKVEDIIMALRDCRVRSESGTAFELREGEPSSEDSEGSSDPREEESWPEDPGASSALRPKDPEANSGLRRGSRGEKPEGSSGFGRERSSSEHSAEETPFEHPEAFPDSREEGSSSEHSAEESSERPEAFPRVWEEESSEHPEALPRVWEEESSFGHSAEEESFEHSAEEESFEHPAEEESFEHPAEEESFEHPAEEESFEHPEAYPDSREEESSSEHSAKESSEHPDALPYVWEEESSFEHSAEEESLVHPEASLDFGEEEDSWFENPEATTDLRQDQSSFDPPEAFSEIWEGESSYPERVKLNSQHLSQSHGHRGHQRVTNGQHVDWSRRMLATKYTIWFSEYAREMCGYRKQFGSAVG